ncbi:ABC transporter B family member 19 isoform X5 [Physcomitrium patens]|uniref:ABC transporter B family member 19 isoform X5 n=1 Tax=Physcomitrium patens TaxID=3218 RepID=UPI000D170442|nr:ABC transporter B family member 10-like isoform X6 [Physcomitrium patens]|eukprot:XP_024371037.1 ABC transporter B family member 10-like isoform X6 [Physcomitrella patens]
MKLPELDSVELENRVKEKRKSMIEKSESLSAPSRKNCDYEAMGLQSLRTPSPKQQSRPITPKNSSKQTKIRNIKGKVQRVAYHKLFSFADKVDYVLMVVGGTAAVLHGAAVPVFFIYFSRLINDLGHSMGDPMKQTAEVSRYSMNFFYLGIHCLVTAWLEVSCWMITGERQSARIRTKYLHAILSEEVGFFDTDSCTSELVSRISSDTLLVQEAIGDKAGNFLHYAAVFVSGICVSFGTVWQLTAVTLSVLPLLAAAGGAYLAIRVGQTKWSQEAYSKAGSIAEEAIAQVRTVYSFVGEVKTQKAYSKALHRTLDMAKRAGIAKGLSVGLTHGLLIAVWGLLFWYASLLVLRKSANGGQAFTTIINAVISGLSLGQIAPNIHIFAKGTAAGFNVMQVIERKRLRDCRRSTDGKILPQLAGHIELRDISFSYPSRPNVKIFDKFNITIPAGTTVAIVGNSGSGKSTIISLIERFYDPTAGEVLVDGHDIKTLRLSWLRGKIGLVNQEPVLFATSILENILYGKEGASAAEVTAMAKASNAHSFIDKLPQRYDTQVGERGVQLSGGQKQRVAIARAMLKNPTILLLDEATSALDAGSEQLVQEALDRLMIGRTTVVIAHRLSTIRNANAIFVVQNGRVVESGTHNELLGEGNEGAYAKLVRLQQTDPFKETVREKSPWFDNCIRSGTPGITTRHSSPGSERGDLYEVSLSPEPLFTHPQDMHLPGSILPNVRESKSSDCSPTLTMHNSKPSRLSSLIEQLNERHSARPHHDTSDSDISAASTSGSTPKTVLISCEPSFRRLLMLNAPEWPYAILGSIGASLAGWKTPLAALGMSDILVSFYTFDDWYIKHQVRKICLLFTGAIPVTVLAFVMQNYFFEVMGERLTIRVREKMLTSILRQEVGWFDQDENNSSLVASRLSMDATLVRAFVGDRASVILMTLALMLLAFGIAFYLDWKVAFVVLATYPFMVGAFIGEHHFLKGFGGDVAKAYARASMVATEAVSNIRTVAAFCAEDKVLDLFIRELALPKRRAFVRGQVAGIGYGLSQFFVFSSYGLAMWYSSTLVTHGGFNDFSNIIRTFIVLVVTAVMLAESLTMAPDILKGSQYHYRV